MTDKKNFDPEIDHFVNQHYEYTLNPDDEAGNALKPSPNLFSAPASNKCRFLSKQGRYQVKRKGKINKRQRYVNDIFTTFVDMRWRWTLLTFASFFIISWLLFTLIYMLIEYCYFHSYTSGEIFSDSRSFGSGRRLPSNWNQSHYDEYESDYTCINQVNNDLNPGDDFRNETNFFIGQF